MWHTARATSFFYFFYISGFEFYEISGVGEGAIQRDRHEKIWTSKKPGGKGRYKKPIDTIIVVSHGLTIRAFVMMWCRLSPEWLDNCRNPPNCSIRVISSTTPGWDAGYIFGGYSHVDGEEMPLTHPDLQRADDHLSRAMREDRSSGYV